MRRPSKRVLGALLVLCVLVGRTEALEQVQGILNGADRPEAVRSAFQSDVLGRFPQLEVLLEKGDRALEALKFEEAAAAYEKAQALLEAGEAPFAPLDRLRFTLVLTYMALGDPKKPLALAKDLLRSRRALAPPDHRKVAEAYRLLAAVHLVRLRPVDAFAPAAQAMKIARENLGEDDIDTARAEMQQCALKLLSGDLKGARELYDPALRKVEKAVGKDAADLAFFLPMGAAFQLVDGNRDEAKSILQKALVLQRRHLGKDNPYQIPTLRLLAVLQLSEDRLGEGIATLERCQQTITATFGDDHPTNAALLDGLAELEARRQHFRRSYDHASRSLAIRKKVYGDGAPETGQSLLLISKLISRLGRRDEALQMARDAARLNQIAFGSEHPVMAESWMGVALAYWGTGDYKKAISFGRRAERILMKRFGPTYEGVARMRLRRGALAVMCGDMLGAREHLDSVFPFFEARAEGQPELFGLLQALRGTVLLELDQEETATEVFASSLEHLERWVKESRNQLVFTWSGQARLAIRRGDLKEAKRLHGEITRAYKGLPPASNSWMAVDEIELLAALSRKKPGVARKVAARFQKRVTKSVGGDHPAYGMVLRYRARAEALGGETEAAIETIGKALSIAERTQGKSSWEAGLCRLRLAEFLKAAGKPHQESADKAHRILKKVFGPEAARTRRAAELTKQ